MTPPPRYSLAALLLTAATVGLLGITASGMAPQVSASADDPLGKDLDAILADPSLHGGDVGLVVRRAADGSVLYSSQSGRRGQPASTTKLVSSAAAFEVLGPDHRFTTGVHALGEGPVVDNLYLRGTGDPTMLAADYDALAGQVAARGVKIVRGELVADDTWFDNVRLGSGWAWDDEPYYYSGQISALTVSPDPDFDAGSVIVRVAPAAPGAPAAVDTDPPTDYVRIENNTVTGPAGSESTVSVDRRHGTNTFTVTGSIPADGATRADYMAVSEPTGLAASIFRAALARHGVRVAGKTSTGATPPGSRTLAERRSMPLRELAVPFLKLSNNMHAEILVKSAGRAAYGEGSWQAGLRAYADKFGGLGLDKDDLYFVDGSGLSRMDHVSPDQLTSLLLAAKGKPWFPAWYQALPIAGNPDRLIGGTLRNRMRGTLAENNVHAKTGSLTGVSGLAGYVTSAGGEELVFAMISNNVLGGRTKALEDAVAVRLAGYLGDADVSRPAFVPTPPRQVPAPGQPYRADLECSWVKAC
jgi:D-alanyl-D-alanine carboxypeptidase/D-alanyl-D-alanine-endopeptidase (penicillin-binding protein 4)